MSIVTRIVVLIVLPFDSIAKHFSFTSRLYLQDAADLALCLQPPQIKHSELSPAKSDTFSFFLFGTSTCLEGANTGRSQRAEPTHGCQCTVQWALPFVTSQKSNFQNLSILFF